jgi:hypothetical protein
MIVDFERYRASPLERTRTEDFLRVLPRNRDTVLEIGAREGFFSRILTDYFAHVTALDLTTPKVSAPRITPVRGDVTNLRFPDRRFDVVCCLEVLEQIPPALAQQACREMARVARHEVVIRVPFQQDTRIGRTTCLLCGRHNPPWGHVNSFDEDKLRSLFPTMHVSSVSYAGERREATNALSVLLMDLAGNPWGTYEQEERCVYCNGALHRPAERDFLDRGLAALALVLNRLQAKCTPPSPIWMHMVLGRA